MDIQRNKSEASASCSSQGSNAEKSKIKVNTSTEEMQTVRARSQVTLATSLRSDFPRLGDFLKDENLMKSECSDVENTREESGSSTDASGACSSLLLDEARNIPAQNLTIPSSPIRYMREHRTTVSTPDGNTRSSRSSRSSRDKFRMDLASTLNKDFPYLQETVENKLITKYENLKITSTAESKKSKK